MVSIETVKNKVKEVYGQSSGFVKAHPYKTAATFVAIVAAASLTTAYFLSPAYATFVGTSVTKTATFVSPAITGMSALAIAHPLVASLIVVAAVAALITATVLEYKNNSKAGEIENLKQENAALITATVLEYKNNSKAGEIENLKQENSDKERKIEKVSKLIEGKEPNTDLKVSYIQEALGISR